MTSWCEKWRHLCFRRVLCLVGEVEVGEVANLFAISFSAYLRSSKRSHQLTCSRWERRRSVVEIINVVVEVFLLGPEHNKSTFISAGWLFLSAWLLEFVCRCVCVCLQGCGVAWGETWKRWLRRGHLVTRLGSLRNWDSRFLKSARSWDETM